MQADGPYCGHGEDDREEPEQHGSPHLQEGHHLVQGGELLQPSELGCGGLRAPGSPRVPLWPGGGRGAGHREGRGHLDSKPGRMGESREHLQQSDECEVVCERKQSLALSLYD